MEDPKISTILIPPFLTILRKFLDFFFWSCFGFCFLFLKFERETGEGDSLSSLGVSKLLIQFSLPARVPGNRLNEGSRGKDPQPSAPEEGEGADRKRAVSLSNQYITKKSVQSQGTLLSRGCCRRLGQGPRSPV